MSSIALSIGSDWLDWSLDCLSRLPLDWHFDWHPIGNRHHCSANTNSFNQAKSYVLDLAMETRDNPYILVFFNGTDSVLATPSLLLKERLNDYVVELRKQDYPAIVYEKKLNRLLQEEAQWIAAKNREMGRGRG
jgi:hypothetical protein